MYATGTAVPSFFQNTSSDIRRTPDGALPSGTAFYNGCKSGASWNWNLVANDSSDFFTAEGSNYLRSPIQCTEAGNVASVNVWTNFKPIGGGSYLTRDLSNSYCNIYPGSALRGLCSNNGACLFAWENMGGPMIIGGCASSFHGISTSMDIKWSLNEYYTGTGSSCTPSSHCDACTAGALTTCQAQSRALYCVEQ